VSCYGKFLASVGAILDGIEAPTRQMKNIVDFVRQAEMLEFVMKLLSLETKFKVAEGLYREVAKSRAHLASLSSNADADKTNTTTPALSPSSWSNPSRTWLAAGLLVKVDAHLCDSAMISLQCALEQAMQAKIEETDAKKRQLKAGDGNVFGRLSLCPGGSNNAR